MGQPVYKMRRPSPIRVTKSFLSKIIINIYLEKLFKGMFLLVLLQN